MTTHNSPLATPLHIGILCDYGFTLLPKSGIGVFVYNLIEGLLTLPHRPRVTLLAHPGDQQELEECANRWEDRVRILPPPEENRTPAARIERRLTALCGRSLKLETGVGSAWDRVFGNVKQRGLALLKDDLQTLRPPAEPARPSARLSWGTKARAATRLILLSILLGIGSWMGEILHALILGFLVPTLLFPIRLAPRVFAAVRGSAHPLEARMAAAGCDVWLVPYPGTETPILAPHVLVIFDLVFRHVPEVYSTGERDHFERLFAARAREATLIYCGSNFVRDHDLIPSYPFATGRIRVFRLAPPLDLQPGGTMPDLRTLLSKYGIRSRFLFYPAALRAHKNHAMLVRAFSLLRKKAEYSGLELVFTGEGRQSPDLLRLVHSEGLTEFVHFLGIIDRQDLLTLYQQAVLVPLPSLHEGYGLPLLEALQNHCPVACADIPAFRELLEGQDDTVRFFDPRDPSSIANAIALTMARRDDFQKRQTDAFRQIARRDWHAVGQDFLQIFEEAYHLAAANKAPEEAIHNAA
jgi:glycosyltransferase involved in cell wall biosynthesis